MRENPTKSALLVIDMENGFVNPKSVHCIRQAKGTLKACEKAVRTAREKGIPVFFVKRIYRYDGSDVEMTRYKSWKEGGRAMGPGSSGEASAEAPEGLKPQKGDYTIIKPRWSAFFHTELDLILRRLRVDTVILTGTTTPNCIRTTCYDADALEYNVVVLEDCCSSATEEIQQANMADMERMGAVIMTSGEFEQYGPDSVEKLNDTIYREMRKSDQAPEPFGEEGDSVGWKDLW